jgi:hypothetical protein
VSSCRYISSHHVHWHTPTLDPKPGCPAGRQHHSCRRPYPQYHHPDLSLHRLRFPRLFLRSVGLYARSRPSKHLWVIENSNPLDAVLGPVRTVSVTDASDKDDFGRQTTYRSGVQLHLGLPTSYWQEETVSKHVDMLLRSLVYSLTERLRCTHSLVLRGHFLLIQLLATSPDRKASRSQTSQSPLLCPLFDMCCIFDTSYSISRRAGLRLGRGGRTAEGCRWRGGSRIRVKRV